jgi:hypothetical protein
MNQVATGYGKFERLKRGGDVSSSFLSGNPFEQISEEPLSIGNIF